MTLSSAPTTPAPPPRVPAARGAESRDPGTGEVWRTWPPASDNDVANAIARARQEQPAWARTSVAARGKILTAFRHLLLRDLARAADVIARESGKPVPEAMVAEVIPALDHARFAVRTTPRLQSAGWFTPTQAALWRKSVRVSAEPWGVIGVISPWNYPLMLPAGIVLPALATGNAVVLKPSEVTPSSAALLGELLREAGLPDGLFTVLQGDGAVGRALIDAGVDKLFFTGSVATGRLVAARCGERLIPSVLELGGSDAAIVLADADVRHAAAGLAWARVSNAGQTCVAPKRVFVEAAAFEPLVAALRERFATLRVGVAHDGSCDVGALIRPNQHAALGEQLADAVERGAIVAAASTAPAGGEFFAPVVLTGAPDGARVYTEETFGPVLPVRAVRDVDEAVALANASPFGLSASVWSRSRRRARAVADRLQAGSVMINDAAAVAGIADVPHGGVKMSGTGRAHGYAGIEECVRPRALVDDLLPGVPEPWWFHYSPAMTRDLVAYARFSHGRSLWERVSGIRGSLRLLFRRR